MFYDVFSYQLSCILKISCGCLEQVKLIMLAMMMNKINQYNAVFPYFQQTKLPMPTHREPDMQAV